MDVFLEQNCEWSKPSVISRISVARPLQSRTKEQLFEEVERLTEDCVRQVIVRRQQLLRIGRHALPDILADSGISITCLGYAGGFTGTMRMSYDESVADVRQAIRQAASVNARFLVVLPGGQGIHTYRHAETTIRMGLQDVALFAEQNGIRMLVPIDSVLDTHRDCFRPKQCPLNWIMQMGLPSVRPLIVVRGRFSARRFPRGWREALEQGGAIRICPRCPCYPHNVRQLAGVLQFLDRREGASRFERLLSQF